MSSPGLGSKLKSIAFKIVKSPYFLILSIGAMRLYYQQNHLKCIDLMAKTTPINHTHNNKHLETASIRQFNLPVKEL